jgi:subtilisin family serine protease
MRLPLRFVLGGLLLAATLALSGAAFGGESTAPAVGDRDYIVVLRGSVDPAIAVERHARRYGADVSLVYRHALKGYAAKLSPAAVTAIAADSAVAFVTEDSTFAATSCSPFLVQCLPLGLDRIDAEQSSAFSRRPPSPVNVAVLDTGIDLTHPDLNVAGGFDCVRNQGNGQDEDGHGTHVAGTIGALNNSVGVVGVLPGARLWSIRVLNAKGYGTNGRILCGIDFVTSTRTDADPTNDIAVANMSLAGQGLDDGNCGRTNRDAEHVAICASVAAGVTYVVSAGNNGQDFQNIVPATYDEVLTVTAMTDFDGRPGGLGGETCLPDYPFADDTVAFFSSFATLPSDRAHTVSASGVCILSTYLGGGYDLISGTSQSAPAVTGTVALCIAVGPCAGLTPAQVIQKIVSDAAAYNSNRRNSGYGFGGDPLRPITGKYYGYLIRAGLY